MSLGRLFTFSSHGKPAEQEIDARIAATTKILAAQGMDTKMTVEQAVVTIPGFYPSYSLINGKFTSIIYHDLCHIVSNGFRGPTVDLSDNGAKVEHLAYVAGGPLIAKVRPDAESMDRLREKMLQKVRKGIETQYKYSPPVEYDDLKPFNNRRTNAPQMIWENYPEFEHAIDRGLAARDFFTQMTGMNPLDLGEKRLHVLPLSFFGVYPIPREDGKTARFDFYPDDMRVKAIAAAQGELTAEDHNLLETFENV